jgi:alanyl-tRNA synthetase
VLKEMDLEEPSVTLFLTTGKKVNVILWTKSMPKDASYYISDVIKSLGGKGGGSAESFTGGFAEVDDPKGVFDTLVDKVRERILIS